MKSLMESLGTVNGAGYDLEYNIIADEFNNLFIVTKVRDASQHTPAQFVSPNLFLKRPLGRGC